MEKESIFLTTHEAVEAIICDFRQYDAQIVLFAGILPLITDNRIHLKRDHRKTGAWVNRTGKSQMKWLDGPELVEYMCNAIHQTPWDPELLASVCARVFRTRSIPHENTSKGHTGVLIETDMEAFHCRQCGFCCRFLDYHNEVTAEDVALWKASKRNDILKWVHEITVDGEPRGYRAWVVPSTQKQAEACPFLEKAKGLQLWRCRIHDVKPAICRQYPLSRKHAVMSGCSGFKGLDKKY